jgi:hypothetical protein
MVQIMRLRLQGGSPLRRRHSGTFQRDSVQRFGKGNSGGRVAPHHPGAAFIEA